MVLYCSKRLSTLLRRIASKHLGDFYFLNCLYSHKDVCENKDFCNIVKASEDTNILEFYQYQKSDKAPFVIYADLECLIEKIDGCKNNPVKPSTKMSTTLSFKSI